jgi:hypothetical protein
LFRVGTEDTLPRSESEPKTQTHAHNLRSDALLLGTDGVGIDGSELGMAKLISAAC